MKNLRLKNSDKKYWPGKIICVGKNYADHVKEMGGEVLKYPVVFLKPASNLIFNDKKIVHPSHSKEMHHEVELVLLIGRDVKDADDKSAEEAIAGYTVGLDMTLRDIQWECKEKGQPWTLAKCFDTAAVVSNIVMKEDYQLKGTEKIELSVNKELRQNASLDQMLFNSVEIVKYLSSKMTLEEGDLVFTGTPAGVGKVVPGDLIEVKIENIGEFEIEVINN
ncbi:MAG: fumarylacetoacetate hydrolase family protein [Melioribacteraceae bacterium]|nr:fumarylacetoacetate hydrolase family protein [Melioribacteraceae bacterium]